RRAPPWTRQRAPPWTRRAPPWTRQRAPPSGLPPGDASPGPLVFFLGCFNLACGSASTGGGGSAQGCPIPADKNDEGQELEPRVRPFREPADGPSRRAEPELERRNRELVALNELGRTLASTLVLSEIYRVMYQEIAQKVLGAQHMSTMLYDAREGLIRFGFTIADGKETDASSVAPIPLGLGPVSETIRSRRPQLVDLREVFAGRRPMGQAQILGDQQIQPLSALYVPLLAGDEVIGVISVQHDEPEAFFEADLELVGTMANQAAIALRNAQLLDEAR